MGPTEAALSYTIEYDAAPAEKASSKLRSALDQMDRLGTALAQKTVATQRLLVDSIATAVDSMVIFSMKVKRALLAVYNPLEAFIMQATRGFFGIGKGYKDIYVQQDKIDKSWFKSKQSIQVYERSMIGLGEEYKHHNKSLDTTLSTWKKLTDKAKEYKATIASAVAGSVVAGEVTKGAIDLSRLQPFRNLTNLPKDYINSIPAKATEIEGATGIPEKQVAEMWLRAAQVATGSTDKERITSTEALLESQIKLKTASGPNSTLSPDDTFRMAMTQSRLMKGSGDPAQLWATVQGFQKTPVAGEAFNLAQSTMSDFEGTNKFSTVPQANRSKFLEEKMAIDAQLIENGGHAGDMDDFLEKALTGAFTGEGGQQLGLAQMNSMQALNLIKSGHVVEGVGMYTKGINGANLGQFTDEQLKTTYGISPNLKSMMGAGTEEAQKYLADAQQNKSIQDQRNQIEKIKGSFISMRAPIVQIRTQLAAWPLAKMVDLSQALSSKVLKFENGLMHMFGMGGTPGAQGAAAPSASPSGGGGWFKGLFGGGSSAASDSTTGAGGSVVSGATSSFGGGSGPSLAGFAARVAAAYVASKVAMKAIQFGVKKAAEKTFSKVMDWGLSKILGKSVEEAIPLAKWSKDLLAKGNAMEQGAKRFFTKTGARILQYLDEGKLKTSLSILKERFPQAFEALGTGLRGIGTIAEKAALPLTVLLEGLSFKDGLIKNKALEPLANYLNSFVDIVSTGWTKGLDSAMQMVTQRGHQMFLDMFDFITRAIDALPWAIKILVGGGSPDLFSKLRKDLDTSLGGPEAAKPGLTTNATGDQNIAAAQARAAGASPLEAARIAMGKGVPAKTTATQATSAMASTKSSTANTAQFDSLIQASAKKYGVDPDIIRAMMQQESSGNSTALSNKGARGLMQVIPSTAKAMGYSDADMNDPAKSIDAGTRYFRQQMDDSHGNVSEALARYNAGPGNVNKYGGVPPFKETQNYVSKIMGNISKMKAAEAAGGSEDVVAELKKIRVAIEDGNKVAQNVVPSAPSIYSGGSDLVAAAAGGGL